MWRSPPLSFHPHTHSFSFLVKPSAVYSNLGFRAFISFLLPPVFRCDLVAAAVRRRDDLPPNYSNSEIFSASPPHAVPAAAPTPPICPAGPWQAATAAFLQPNFDWPSSSSHSRVLYFFPFSWHVPRRILPKALMRQWK